MSDIENKGISPLEGEGLRGDGIYDSQRRMRMLFT